LTFFYSNSDPQRADVDGKNGKKVKKVHCFFGRQNTGASPERVEGTEYKRIRRVEMLVYYYGERG
jgi:hypothetical protein